MDERSSRHQAYSPRGSLVLAALNELPDSSIMVFDRDLRYVVVRGEALHDGGRSPTDLEDHLAADVLSPERWAVYEPLYRAALQGETASLEVGSPSDHDHRFLVRIGPVRDPSGKVIGGVSVATGISEQVRLLRALAESEEQFRLTMESATIGMAITAADGRFVEVNPALAAMLGYERDELAGRRFADLTHPDDVGGSVEAMRDLVEGRRTRATWRKRYLRRDGSVVWVDLSVAPVRREDGSLRHFVSQMVDVTDEVAARTELTRSESRFRLAMSAAPIGMALSDPTGAFVQVNEALCRLLGVTEPDLLGRAVADFLPEEEKPRASDATEAFESRQEDAITHEHHLVGRDHLLWVQHSVSLLRDDGGEPVFYVHQFVDQTEAHELRQDLEYRASHDALTGVVNRGELMRRLELVLRHGGGSPSWLGVLFVDVDNLKTLNDEYGHHTGDVAIQAVAERLLGAVRRRDTVARIGGDEFVVLLEGLPSREELAAVAEKCRTAVEGPIDVDGRAIEVTVSVGAVLADHSESSDEVLARADHALHRAKAGGRRQVDLD